jgi:hypothetical protein
MSLSPINMGGMNAVSSGNWERDNETINRAGGGLYGGPPKTSLKTKMIKRGDEGILEINIKDSKNEDDSGSSGRRLC